MDAVDTAIRALSTTGVSVLSVELSESVTADQRSLHVEAAASTALDKGIAAAVAEARLAGATAGAANGTTAAAGDPIITDSLSTLSDGRIQSGVLRRHPQAFFQSNRFLISSLVGAVLDAVPVGPVLDLYAGVGLFSVALSANGHQEVTAVEGNPVSAADLKETQHLTSRPAGCARQRGGLRSAPCLKGRADAHPRSSQNRHVQERVAVGRTVARTEDRLCLMRPADNGP